MRYRFGQYTLDADTRQLLRGDREVHLSPKCFDLLALLITNRGRAMSKAELQQMLWPSTFVEETNLAGLVVHLRRALHDPAEKPNFIRTVYGFGYRFVGDVDSSGASTKSTSHVVRLFLVFPDRPVPLLEGANVVGRAVEATIQVDRPGISRRHAQITVVGAKAILEDLGSKNGTRLNGRPVSGGAELSDGDRIQIGEVEAVFRTGTEMSDTRTLLD